MRKGRQGFLNFGFDPEEVPEAHTQKLLLAVFLLSGRDDNRRELPESGQESPAVFSMDEKTSLAFEQGDQPDFFS